MAHVNCLLRTLDIPDGGESGIPPYGVPYFTGKNNHYHSFSGPNVCLARLQMELCRAASISAAG